MNSEKPQKCHLSALSLICAMLLICSCLSCSRTQGFRGYDGSWWMNTPLDQRLGFIDGYVNGYYYGPGEGKALNRRRSGLQAAISAYYQTHRGDMEMLVGQVLRRVTKEVEASSPDISASPIEAKQGGEFDGLVWWHYSEKERIGFVEGFLNALMPQTSRRVSFPKSPEYYADEISSWYGFDRFDNNHGKIPDEMLKHKVGQILWAMRNTGSGPQITRP